MCYFFRNFPFLPPPCCPNSNFSTHPNLTLSSTSQFFAWQNKITTVLDKQFVSNTTRLQHVDRTIPSSEQWMSLVTVASGELLSAAVYAATLHLSLSTGRIQFSGPDNNPAKHVDRLHFEMSYYGNSTIREHELGSVACVNTSRVAVNSCSNYHLTVRMFRVGLEGSDCSL